MARPEVTSSIVGAVGRNGRVGRMLSVACFSFSAPLEAGVAPLLIGALAGDATLLTGAGTLLAVAGRSPFAFLRVGRCQLDQ